MKGRIEDKIKYEKKLQQKIYGMPEYIQDYYFSLNEKTYLTKSRYINNVIRFLNWFGNGDINNVSEEKLERITQATIQRFIQNIQYLDSDKELGDDAKANMYSSINSFLTYLKGNNIIEDNPFDGKRINRPKTHDNEITFLEPEEYKMIKAAIMKGTGSSRSIAKQKNWMYRDLLLFQIPIITGVRVTALSQIAIEDIDFEKKTIKVIDKARDKTLFLDDETMGMIYVWLKIREELMIGYKDNGYLFISNQRTKMDVRSIEYVIKKYTEGVVNKHITPHKLRSTCGTNMYRATKDIYMVAETLGHKSPATSRKYTKVGNEDRINATNKLSEFMKNM